MTPLPAVQEKKERKKKDRTNFRLIDVQPVFRKLFNTIMDKRIRALIQLEECQAGFWPQRRTSVILHDVISSHARKRESNEPLFILVLDFSKAFDRVNHKVLFRKLMEKGIGGNLLGTLMDMYTDAKATFLINSTLVSLSQSQQEWRRDVF